MTKAPTNDGAGARLSTSAAGRRRFVARIEAAHRAYEEVCARNGEAAEAGDNSVWHDNFDYEENQRQMHQLARRVRDLQEALGRLDVVGAPRAPTRVGYGCAVTVERDDGRVERFVIGGYEDGDPSQKRVAYTTPMAQALMQAEPGDSRTLAVAGRSREYTVLSVAAAHEDEL